MVSGASKTFKVLMEAVFCFKDALEGVDCSAVFLASCGKLFQQHVFLDHNLPKVQQVFSEFLLSANSPLFYYYYLISF